jgi:hypothetical protein
MCRIVERQSGNLDSRHNQGEDHAGTDKSSRAQGKVPDDHQGDRGSSEGLVDSGRVTCQCRGPVGTRTKWKEG